MVLLRARNPVLITARATIATLNRLFVFVVVRFAQRLQVVLVEKLGLIALVGNDVVYDVTNNDSVSFQAFNA